MSWANPAIPNLPDFLLFLQDSMEFNQYILPTIVPPPAAPPLTASTTGGSFITGTVYVAITYVSLYGETTISSQSSIAVTGPTAQVVVASPPAAPGCVGYNVYANAISGPGPLQNSGPIALGIPFTLNMVVSGVTPPSTNTAGSPWPSYAFNQAMGLVLNLGCNGGVDLTLATYNCAGHIQIEITPDQPGRSGEPGSFTKLRDTFFLLKESVGVVLSTSNGDSSTTIAVPDSLKQLTLTDLGFMKTPWGRRFLSFNQDYGPTVWALS